jgi:Carboxypeptidase regulatory-like domain
VSQLSAFVLGAVLAGAAAMGQAPKVVGYPISGTVVDHVTNRPIARALVRLSPVNGPGELNSMTDESGQFAFSDIPKGKYRLAAQRRGQRPQWFHETGQYSTAVVTGPDVDSTGIVFPLQALGSISGSVLDEEGEPVPSANVQLLREMVNEGEKQVLQVGNCTANSLAQFRCGNLAAGTYYLAVQVPPSQGAVVGGPQVAREVSDVDVTYPLTYYGDTSDGQAASPIQLAEGAMAQVQVTMRPVPIIHVPFAGGRSGNGSWSPPQLFVRGPGGVRMGVSNFMLVIGDNKAEISGIPAGHYLVQYQRFSPGRSPVSTFQDLDLADGAPLTVANSVNGSKISGQVVFEGGVHPESPLQLVFFDRTNGGGTGAEVGADGTIAFKEGTFAPGLYSMQTASPGFYLRSITVKGARKVGGQIELLEGSSASITIVATPVESLSKLDGFALRDGKPVPGAMVLLVPKNLESTSLFRRDQSDSDGSFTMAAIPAGQYTLIGIDDDGRGLAYKDRAVLEPYLADGQTIEFPLRSKEPVKVSVRARIR